MVLYILHHFLQNYRLLKVLIGGLLSYSKIRTMLLNHTVVCPNDADRGGKHQLHCFFKAVWSGLNCFPRPICQNNMSRRTKKKKKKNDLCAQRRLRSAWVSSQSSSLSAWRKIGSLATYWVHTVKTLISLGGCPVWSESSLGAHHFVGFASYGSLQYMDINQEELFHSVFKRNLFNLSTYMYSIWI